MDTGAPGAHTQPVVSTDLPTPSPRRLRWVVLTFVFALGVFTALSVRDAGRPAIRPAAGGTFTGRDVDGRLVQVCLFERDGGWQGWLYREGREQTPWFRTEDRTHPWREGWLEEASAQGREDAPNHLATSIASTGDPLRLNATLPRANGWASDTANLTRQFEHLSFRRLTGLRLWGWGGTQEFRAQFPRLPDGSEFHGAIGQEIVRQCEAAAAEFTSDPLEFWRENLRLRQPMMMNAHELTAHWQLRLLTTNLASFCVWSYDEVGGNGNHSHWNGVNFVTTGTSVRELKIAELFRAETGWQNELRARCVPKLQAGGAPDRAWGTVTAARTDVDIFTLSEAGLQLYFNPYILGSGADGEFVVHFDYAELKDLLRADGPAALLPRAP